MRGKIGFVDKFLTEIPMILFKVNVPCVIFRGKIHLLRKVVSIPIHKHWYLVSCYLYFLSDPGIGTKLFPKSLHPKQTSEEQIQH